MSQITEFIKVLLVKIGLSNHLKPIYRLLYNKVTSKRFQKSASSNLTILHKSLANIEYWLEFGTLLGAYRENGFIAHDNDIDLATYQENHKEVEKQLTSAGFLKTREIKLKSSNLIVEQTYLLENSSVDIFYVVQNDNQFITYDFASSSKLTWKLTIKKYGGLLAYANYMSPFKLKEIYFLDMKFLIPANTESHLQELYGKNFMTPIPNWKLDKRPIRFLIKDFGILTNRYE